MSLQISSLKDISKISLSSLKAHESRVLDLIGHIVVGCLIIMIFLLPLQRFSLPFNTAAVDLWNLFTIIIVWLFLLKMYPVLRLPYAPAVWLILLGSLLGTMQASDSLESIIVITKDVYLYFWFVTLAVVFSILDFDDFHLVLKVWLLVTLINGALILAQFLSPEVLRYTTMQVGKYSAMGSYRPLGLFMNPNMSAGFQLMGFTPLILLWKQTNSKVMIVIGSVLLLSIFASGSLGASIAFLGGSLTYIMGYYFGNRKEKIKIFLKFLLVLFLLAIIVGGLVSYVLNNYPEVLYRLKYISYDRFEDSMEKRFILWEQGADLFLGQFPIWGSGPGNYSDDVWGLRKPEGAHNDFIAFLIERGLLGMLGLVLLAASLLEKSCQTFLLWKNDPIRAKKALVFLAVLVSMIIESQTHQIFHFRVVWLVFAVQEAIIIRSGFEN
jgi:hypothetical protein